MILETRYFITSAVRRNFRDALAQSDLDSWICSVLSQRGLLPVSPPETPPTLLTASSHIHASCTRACLPHHPKATAGSSNPLTPFPFIVMLSSPWAANDYSLSLSPQKEQTLSICSLRARPVSWCGRRHLAAQPAILFAAPGKGSQMNVGTGFDTPAAKWAMLLLHIPAMSSVKWYTRSTDVVWWLVLAPQHSWSVQHIHNTFSLFIWLKNDEYTAFLLCRNLGQFSLLAEEQSLWYNLDTVLQACCSACVDCLCACKHLVLLCTILLQCCVFSHCRKATIRILGETELQSQYSWGQKAPLKIFKTSQTKVICSRWPRAVTSCVLNICEDKTLHFLWASLYKIWPFLKLNFFYDV